MYCRGECICLWFICSCVRVRVGLIVRLYVVCFWCFVCSLGVCVCDSMCVFYGGLCFGVCVFKGVCVRKCICMFFSVCVHLLTFLCIKKR